MSSKLNITTTQHKQIYDLLIMLDNFSLISKSNKRIIKYLLEWCISSNFKDSYDKELLQKIRTNLNKLYISGMNTIFFDKEKIRILNIVNDQINEALKK